MEAAINGGIKMKKKISISSKRQITIPQKYYEALGFGDEAECTVRGGELVLRPIKENNGGEFAEFILADLIKQGLNGDELLDAFKREQSKVRPAAKRMIDEARLIAQDKAAYDAYEDIFGAED